jgi:hypothetical protein
MLRPVIALLAASTAALAFPPEKIIYKGIEVWRLSDRRTEAIVVPAWGGRLIHYARVGGANWLWSGQPEAEVPYFRWGGDKTYPGPHPMWAFTLGQMWPPPAMDSTPCDAEVKDDHLITTSAPWPAYGGARVVRDYSFSPLGELVIEHHITAVPGNPTPVCAWVIAQCVPAKAYVPMTPDSPYKDGFFWLGGTRPLGVFQPLSPTLLEIAPAPGKAFKLGTPATTCALAARRGKEVFVLRADFVKNAQYPDGAPAAGLTAEYYHHNALKEGEYIELELLSPLRPLRDGVDFTTRWSIHQIEEDSPKGVEALLK